MLKDALTELLKKLEECIDRKEALELSIPPPPPLKVFPYKLVYLQNSLSLVGENLETHQLLVFNVNKIEDAQAIEGESTHNFSTLDINHFIDACRKMSDQEHRLVLKLYNYSGDINLSPKFHFFGNPCLVSNSQGEFIWGASVELNEALLQWLASIKNEIRIIDPPDIQTALDKYLSKKAA